MELIPGSYYTVKTSVRFKGVTGVAIEPAGHEKPHQIHSIDFPDDGVISFMGSLDSLRKAIDKEELEYRRRCDS